MQLGTPLMGSVFKWDWVDDPNNDAYALRTTEIITDVYKKVREIEESVLRGAVVDYLRELGYKIEEPTE